MSWERSAHAAGLYSYEIAAPAGAHVYLTRYAGRVSLVVTVLNDGGDTQASVHLELTPDMRAALVDALATIPEEGER